MLETKSLYFLRRFIRNPREVGAVCPSTRFLGRAMIRGLDLKRGDVMLEYGPGTGAFTRVIREQLVQAGGVRYLGIERESGFCDILRQQMPEMLFENGQVENAGQMIAAHGLQRPRAIVSGLPLIFLPTMDEIVRDAYELLEDGGSFRTFSYLQSYVTPGARRLRALMKETFDRFEMSRLVGRNFPPAFVLRGEKSPAPGENQGAQGRRPSGGS